MGPAEIIIGVSIISKITVIPKVIAKLMAIGRPPTIITFGFL